VQPNRYNLLIHAALTHRLAPLSLFTQFNVTPARIQVLMIFNMQPSSVPPALRLVNGSRGVVRRLLSLDECRKQLQTQLCVTCAFPQCFL
jgi:hypothetical protein